MGMIATRDHDTGRVHKGHAGLLQNTNNTDYIPPAQDRKIGRNSASH